MSSAEPTKPPESHIDLLERPLFATLATIRPDGSPQASQMWFDWDGSHLRFTHTRTRQKYRNLTQEPRVSVTLADPDDPYRYLEVRGTVIEIAPDPGADLLKQLQSRYGMPSWSGDADVRVVITVVPTGYVAVRGGLTDRERERPDLAEPS